MQIVIDIPKHIYDCVIGKTVLLSHMDVMCKAIEKGKPLPKGHGDLIDRNKLAHKMVVEDVSRFKEEPEALAGLFLRMCDKAQAIIEADTESEV